MKNCALKTLVIVFCMIFLAETTGIALFIHTCKSSESIDMRAFTESKSCCCETETVIANTDNYAFDTQECCKSELKYIISEYSGFPVFLKQNDERQIFILLFNTQNFILEPKNSHFDSYLTWLDYSPPLSGASLVYFIQQIRIPFPTC